MKKIFLGTLFLFTVHFSFGQSYFIQKDSLRGNLSSERSCFDVNYYALSLAIDIDNQSISGNNKIYFTVQKSFSLIQLDLNEALLIKKIINKKGDSLSFYRNKNSFFVRFNELQEQGSNSFIQIFYEGKPDIATNPPWDGGFIWTQDSLKRPWVAVACEGVGASLWWPCKDHPSDEPDSMSMRFEVSNNLFCASNGNLISTVLTERNTSIYEWKVSYPINIYNITLNIGNYIHFSDTYFRKDSTTLSLDYYVLSYNKERAKKHFEQVKKMLFCYEKLFGKYPYEKDGYALIEAPYWGMEHQSGIAYGNQYKNNMVGLDYIIVHESGHEWWGNNVSISDHADLWIHEAFTTYSETLLLECLYTKELALNYLATQKKMIKNKEPLLGPYNVNYHYWQDSDMYYKGAHMLHTLRNSIDNDSLWFSMLYAIQKHFGGKQLNSKELIDYINTYTKIDFTSFFHHYLTFTTLPILEYELIQKEDNQLLSYRWIGVEKNFSFPIHLILNNINKIKIYPSTDYKSLKLPSNNNKKLVFFNEDDFLIELKQLKTKNYKK